MFLACGLGRDSVTVILSVFGVRLGERFSYCDPQCFWQSVRRMRSAGEESCAESWVEFSGRLLLVVLESLWCFWCKVGWGRVLCNSGLLRAVWGKIQLL